MKENIVFEIDMATKADTTYAIGQAIGALSLLVVVNEKLSEEQKKYLARLIMTLEDTADCLTELPMVKKSVPTG